MKALPLLLAVVLLPQTAASAGFENARQIRKAEFSVSVRVVRSAAIHPASLDLARTRAAAMHGAAFDAAGDPLPIRVLVEGPPTSTAGTRWMYVFPDSVPKGSPPVRGR